jgi:hypothetical protein
VIIDKSQEISAIKAPSGKKHGEVHHVVGVSLVLATMVGAVLYVCRPLGFGSRKEKLSAERRGLGKVKK